MNTENFKSGFVTIIGKPNVGKSTLMNRLIGEKLSIVSPKPQTTRHEIKGILNTKDCQIIFLDTPGFLEPRYELQRKMMDYIKTALRDADLIIFITDANHFPTDYDEKMLHLIKNIKIPKLALLNKIDLVDEKSAGLSYEQLCQYDFDQVKKVSILHDENLDELEEVIQNYMPYNPPYYSPD